MAGCPVLLLLLLLLAGTPRSARACPGTPGPAPRPGRAPGAALPPPRSRWGPPGGPQARLSPRSRDPPVAPFWTMATPQRFGRRR
ncbi:pro-FMRFamide-related neuropeptide FF-like [Haemorhous mexicanus]|uniref:pro-FMRFamide-related neuropeptide FF-like n=1 Tax=Haemorhous mexicanus TaxID=30427 RepID=UPI0028BD2DC8|nr:pro-FMRFamide-related neuropeptide FF-like [Haemorhous mexicanus]